jgi:hypothetical protein
MSEAGIATLDGRVTALEKVIPEGLRRIEDLIRGEIHDLKTENLSDIKKSIDRIEADGKAAIERVDKDAKTAVERLADDQRRVWEHIGKLELRDGQRTGNSRAFERVWMFASALIGGCIATAGQWLSSRPHP